MSTRLDVLSICCLISLLTTARCASAQQVNPLSKVEVAKRGKAATALVVSARSYGTAFCIHSSGYFLTTNRVVQSAGGQPLKIVLNPGLAKQQILPTKVIRTDRSLDLALLKGETNGPLPSLPLGSKEGLVELAEVVTLGYASNSRPTSRTGEYPSVNVRAGSISSLQRQQGELVGIEIDVSPGIPGGPVLDEYGRVIGLVVGVKSDRSASVSVGRVRGFVSTPLLYFIPPQINLHKKDTPVSFEVETIVVLPSKEPLELELILDVLGEQRTIKMKGESGRYHAKLAPLAALVIDRNPRVTISFEGGLAKGIVKDRTFRIGREQVHLGDVRVLRFGEKPEGILADGRKLAGAIDGLDSLELDVGSTTFELGLKRATQLSVSRPKQLTQIGCTILVRSDGKQVAEVRHAVPVHDQARLLTSLRGHSSRVEEVAFSPDGTLLASCTSRWPSGVRTGEVWLWSTKSGKRVRSLLGHTRSVTGLAFSPDGKRLVTASDDNTVRVWNVATGNTIASLTGHAQSVCCVAYSPDGKRIVSGGYDNSLKVWDAEKLEELSTLEGHRATVYSLSFTPDGKRIVSGSSDSFVKVWDIHDAGELHSLVGHSNWLTSVSVSPDGKRVVSGSYDETVKVWDITTGKRLFSLDGHKDSVQSVCYSPDGNLLASAGADGIVKLWDSETGKELLSFKGHTSAIFSIAFSPDGKKIATGAEADGKRGEIKLWDVSDLSRRKK